MSEPERNLWRAVLEQAYEDAEMLSSSEDKESQPLDCARARRYLRAASLFELGNLELVCDYADVPADRVILWARRRYAARQASDELLECGSEAAASPPAQIVPSEKRESDPPRTPQTAA
jgi:hypothetical protein